MLGSNPDISDFSFAQLNWAKMRGGGGGAARGLIGQTQKASLGGRIVEPEQKSTC